MKNVLRRFAAVVASASVAVSVAGVLPLGAEAQEPAKAKVQAKERAGAKSEAGAGAAKRKLDPSRRLPNLFGQLGLTEAQRTAIYEVQARHIPKIEALEKQLEDERSQLLADCEKVLTPPQKQLLDARRRTASEARKSGASSIKRPLLAPASAELSSDASKK
jgi:hypothetical protein